MSYSFHPILNELPVVGKSTIIYSYLLNNTDYSISSPGITYLKVLYGNVKILNYIEGQFQNPAFIPLDNQPIAIQCVTKVVQSGNKLVMDILYTKAIYGKRMPDNFENFIQKIPKGIFTHYEPEDPQTAWVAAKAGLVKDYYESYFLVKGQVFSTDYSQELEFKYNGTSGLLSDSYDVKGLFHLFSSLENYGLNAYDLELLVSKYIFFRTSFNCPVYIINNGSPLKPYWILEVDGYTQFDQNPPQTVLAPDNYNPVLQNIDWTIYNSGAFTESFKKEVNNFIQRMSRADIGNIVHFSSLQVLDDGFTYIGPTYKGDPRLIYGKCISYIENNPAHPFPLNILGYKKNETI